MSINKLLVTQQWKSHTASVSRPDAGYIKLYYKNGGLYSIDENSIETQYAKPYTFVNGLDNSLSVINVVLGSGLTFSGNSAGSSILVKGLTAGNFNSINSATDGYILSATGSGLFNWIPFNAVGINGNINRIAKFTTSSSISNSLLSDNGDQVYLGTTSTLSGGASFSVSGKANITDSLYFNDNPYKYIDASSGFSINTDNNGFIVRYSSTSYFSVNPNAASILNGFVQFGSASGNYFYIPNVESVIIGTSSISNRVIFNSATPGVLRLVDSTEGLNKFLVSDAYGIGTWQSVKLVNGLTANGITFSVNVGSGLTVSNGLLIMDPGVIGQGLTISGSGTISFATTSVVIGTYGSSQSIPQIVVDGFGRITSITAVTSSGGSNKIVLSSSDKGWTALSVTNSVGTASLSSISNIPLSGSYISVFVNGQEMQVGNATVSAPCFFGTNSQSPRGFSASNSAQYGDYLYWNPAVAGYSLENTFRISLHYLTSS